MDAVRLTVFAELFAAVADEMGEVLRGTAPSVNIRERLDYSCAIFDACGDLVAQAAHIPVHLGSAGLSVAAARARFPDLAPGDSVLLNDPYAGGTHLPDLTLVTPAGGAPHWFLVTRAHHSDVGGSRPGSMAPAADLPAEGLRIPPVRLQRRGRLVDEVLDLVCANTRTPDQRRGDLRAQGAANELGVRRLAALFARYGQATCARAGRALQTYSARLLRRHLAGLRRGRFRCREQIEGDGVRDAAIDLVLDLEVKRGGRLCFDFSRSADQGPGCLNANPAIVLAAVLYSLRCQVPDDLPVNAGLLRGVEVKTRPGSILDPLFPAAVCGGNVETSQRLVDLCFAGLARAGAPAPAQSAGTMNNLSLGGQAADGSTFAVYETLGGGAGASARGPGAAGVQTHMTNTRNTPVEETELRLPITVLAYTLRRGSGGTGRHAGGDGIVKRLRPEVALQASLLAERRRLAPAGSAGGGAGRPGAQVLETDGGLQALPAKGSFDVAAGTTLVIETPGGGGYGEASVTRRARRAPSRQPRARPSTSRSAGR